MRVRYETITCTLEDLQTWLRVIEQLTAGGSPRFHDRPEFHRFRFAMMKNHVAVQAQWDAVAKRVNAERIRILDDTCGGAGKGETRLAEYQRHFATVENLYCARDHHGRPVQAQNGRLQIADHKASKFARDIEALNARYNDIGQAQATFDTRRAAMLAEPIEVRMMCCDYDEIPDDVNASYMGFIERLIMGRPRFQCWHAIQRRRKRHDKAFAAECLARLTKTAEALRGKDALPSEVGAAMFAAVFPADVDEVK